MTKGKTESKHNAITHGIFAGIVLSAPEADDYKRLLEGAEEAIRPANGLERVLVEKLAMLLLRLKRVYKADLETAPAMFERVKGDLDQGFKLNLEGSPAARIVTADTVMRYETSIERQIGRTLSLIQQLRQLRAIDIQPIGKELASAETETMAVAVDPTLPPQAQK